MKTLRLVSLFFVAAALTLGSAGCVHKPTGITQIPDFPGSRGPVTLPVRGGGGAPGPDNGNPLPPPTGVTESNDQQSIGFGADNGQWSGVIANHTEDATTLKADTVYFDFDSATIKTSTGEDKKLNDVAAFLKGHQADALRVEGNCDERGTEKYNLSLGEKRALAVREYLANLGVDPRQVVTVSFGALRPALKGHDEASWSKNRRDDFIVLVPK
jgi:outer membrane protein OmpA-like peptidoglycan-associated protein